MTPSDTLDQIMQSVMERRDQPFMAAPELLSAILLICRNISNRAVVRVVLTCSLAKLHDPRVDIRKPYTEIDAPDAFSGRTVDERYIAPFIQQHALPCNATTAFLTPAFRNRNTALTPDVNLSGRPRSVYVALLQVLDAVHRGQITAQQLLSETLRQLLLFRDEKRQRMDSLITNLASAHSAAPLAAEAICSLIQQHLATKGSSRLPVLIVAAAYTAAGGHLQEKALPLESHTAADRQTHALGDVQITLLTDENIITCYEMKTKPVTNGDIDLVIHEKLARTTQPIDHYVFVTTERIDPLVADYARSWYDRIGIELIILDCMAFLRHFLHLFYRQRMAFLDAYQAFVLAEPESAVSQPLKEVFLSLRHAAESDTA